MVSQIHRIEVPLFLCWFVPRFIWRKTVARRPSGTDWPNQSLLRYITYAQTSEGIGGLALRYVAAVALSRVFGITYLHKKFPPDFHHPELDFDEFLGFGEGERRFEDVPGLGRCKKIMLPVFRMAASSAGFEKKLLGSVFNDLYAENNLLFIPRNYSSVSPSGYHDVLEQIYAEMRQKYWDQRNRRPLPFPFTNNKIGVAVQIRRGEISRRHKQFMPNEWFLGVLETVVRHFGADALDIKIFSDAEDKSSLVCFYSKSNTTVSLSCEDKLQPYKAIHTMACSDIAICSNSCFSLLSARLSSGFRIIAATKEASCEKNPRWIMADACGNFDPHKLDALQRFSVGDKGNGAEKDRGEAGAGF